MTGAIAVTDYRNLASWKQARFAVCAVLAITESLSRRKEYKPFATSIMRLSVSILNNLTKGYESKGDRVFLDKARESIELLEWQLKRAREKEVLTEPDSDRLARELNAAKRSLKQH